jgi:phage gp29-like protein
MSAASEPERLAARLSPWEKLKAYDIGITPEIALSRVIAAASSSDGQRRLFETMIARDADLGNAVDQRCLALSGAHWRFGPRDGVDEAQAAPILASLPDEILDQLTLEHLAMFRLLGYAIAEVEYAPDWTVLGLYELPYAATWASQGDLYVTIGGHQFSVTDPELVDRLIVVRASEHDPASAARLRRVVGLWVTKAYLARDWRKYLERFGDPIIDASYDSERPPAAEGSATPQQSLVNALEDMRAHGILAHADNVKVQLLADARPGATSSFETLWDRCNQGIYRAILGQESTTAQATDGSRASDQVRERTLDSIVEADCKVIRRAIERQLVAKVEAVRAGGRRLVACTATWEAEASQSERATIMVQANTAGIEFDHDAAREELGLEAPSPEQVAAKAQAAADIAARLAGIGATNQPDQTPPNNPDAKPPATMPQGMAARIMRAVRAVFARRPDETLRSAPGTMHQALDAIAAASSGPLARGIERGVMDGLRARLNDGMTLAEVDRAIQDALTQDHVRPVAEVFERAILAARLNGRLLGAAQMARLAKRQETSGAK